MEIYGWTDSKIVLAWLSDHPRKWKNFIANRTSSIISFLPAKKWHHIRSAQNPADLATRGMTPIELQDSSIWWHGPDILKQNNYYQTNEVPTTTMETRKNAVFCIQEQLENENIIDRYSNYTKLLRTTALINRFVNNCRTKADKVVGILKLIELQQAEKCIIKLSQQSTWYNEIKILQSHKSLSNTHILSALNPLMDTNGILRVGGRLENANLPFDQKHPIILHKESNLTTLLIHFYHHRYLHAGVRQLQYLLSMRFWIPGLTNKIKHVVYKCNVCIRYRKRVQTQQMANLPKFRVEGGYTFQNTGVDFAGPLMVRSWKGRGSKQYKCWIVLFICMATKAIHLELCTELSSEAFLATLRRFVSRRGKPTHIYSDNGTNFVGCNQRLKDILQFMRSSKTQEAVAKGTAELGISWHFSPPSGPHFGGIWEAGVKSMKHHLNRVLNNSSMTFEELNTVICQIESCLNSRPLATKFMGDLDPITPGHFLIMRPMQSVVDNDYTNINCNRLTRWQYLQSLTQAFWKRWSTEYVTQLQSRAKWRKPTENLKVDDVVLIKDEQLHPCKWAIGKVLEAHPGHDDLVRVVTVKTERGIYKKPIAKLCKLPVED